MFLLWIIYALAFAAFVTQAPWWAVTLVLAGIVLAGVATAYRPGVR